MGERETGQEGAARTRPARSAASSPAPSSASSRRQPATPAAGPPDAPPPGQPHAAPPGAPPGQPHAARPGLAAVSHDRLIGEWAAALTRTSHVPMSSAEILGFLHNLADRVLSILRTAPFDARDAALVGTALVEAHFVGAPALGQSLSVLARIVQSELGSDLGSRGSGQEPNRSESDADGSGSVDPRLSISDRLDAVREAIATAYVQALRDRTLREQESIRRAEIEARRRAEDALRASEERFRAVFTEAAIGIGLADLDGRIVQANPAFARMLGYTPAEFRNLKVTDFVTLEDPKGRIGICYLDLDGFKLINDTLGHDIGDQLLIAVGGRLDRVVGESSGLGASMGGDEIVVLIEHSDGMPGLPALADRLLGELGQAVLVGEHTINISASIGIVERPAAGTTATDVVKDADGALYWDKSEGPCQWAVYDPSRKAEDATRLTLTASIRTALEKGEFSVLYQPIVELPGATMQGAEALLRWNHPTLGTLPPDTFIALAEASGVITALGRWVIEEACRQASSWHNVRPESAPYVSVNLSVRQAAATDLVDDVARILEETKLPPHLLQLELTEGALVETGGRPLDALQKLSSMGVRIAVDDFGTGYSNLAYLRRLPVDTLKLPGSFVREIPADRHALGDPADEPIISALVRLAHTLGLTVTAEGVENREQAAHLAALGCDAAQGWHFARAVRGDDITALLRASPRSSLGPFHPFSAVVR